MFLSINYLGFTMQFSARVTSIVEERIVPGIADNFFNDNFATFRFISNGKRFNSYSAKKAVLLAKNTQGGSFSGLDVHSTATVETRQKMEYDPRGYEIPVAIPGMDKAVAQGESAIVSLIAAEMETAKISALDDIGDMFYLDGTGNGNKDFLGLDALADDSTSVVTIGGLSRSVYPKLQGTRTASGGTLTMAKLATLRSAVAAGSADKQRPTMILSSETEWNLFESLLSPTVQANYQANGYPMVTRRSRGPVSQAQHTGVGGFTSLVFSGIPWVSDEKAPTGTVWMLNENYIDWLGLKSKDLEQINLSSEVVDGAYSEAPSQNTGLQWSNFMRSINQFGEVGHIYLLGNLVTFQPRRHGRLTGVTGV